MGCAFSVRGLQLLFVHNNSNDSAIGLIDHLQEIPVEGYTATFVSKTGKCSPPVQNVIPVEDDGFVGMVRKMSPFYMFKPLVKPEIGWILKPAPEQAKKAMRKIGEIPENVISRFIEIQTVSVFKSNRDRVRKERHASTDGHVTNLMELAGNSRKF